MCAVEIVEVDEFNENTKKSQTTSWLTRFNTRTSTTVYRVSVESVDDLMLKETKESGRPNTKRRGGDRVFSFTLTTRLFRGTVSLDFMSTFGKMKAASRALYPFRDEKRFAEETLKQLDTC